MSPGVLSLLAIGAVAISLSGPVMASLTVAPLAIAFWRNAFASALLVPVAAARSSTELRGLGGRQSGVIGLAGACLAAHFGLWITSLTMTSVASATAIGCLSVVWVVLAARVAGTPVDRRTGAGVAIALAGGLLVTGVDFSLSTRALVGDLLALAGSVALAAYTVVGARVRRTVSTTAYTLPCYATAAAILLVCAVTAGQPLTGHPAHEWALLLLVALTSQLLGHSVFNHLLRTVSPTVVSLTMLLEIPGAALLAAVWLEQVPSMGAVLGLVMVLAGMAVVVRRMPGPR